MLRGSDPGPRPDGLGLLYGTAQLLQTIGLAPTTASVSGFLTGLYVVATPLLAAWILQTRITSKTPGWPARWPPSVWQSCPFMGSLLATASW